MKAKHCDECKHATVKWFEYKGPPAFDVLTCAKGHKPRYYMPRNAIDTDYGWKRVCGDFDWHNAELRGGVAVRLSERLGHWLTNERKEH